MKKIDKNAQKIIQIQESEGSIIELQSVNVHTFLNICGPRNIGDIK